MRHRIYLKGEPITNPGDAVGIIHGGGYLFFLDRPIHPSWIGSWPVNLLIGACRAGRICRAIPNPDHPKFKEQSK